MQKLLLLTARLALAGWVGGATLFVIAGVREVKSDFDALNTLEVKNALVTVRFPAYYAMGFGLVGLALLCLIGSNHRTLVARLRRWLGVGLVAAALVLMVVDYIWIYRPLLDMVTPPTKARPANFDDYHKASKYINAASLSLCLIAAAMLSWPRKSVE